MVQMAMSKLMGQQNPAAPGGAGPGGPGPDIGDQAAQQGAELQGADPANLLKQLDQINKLLGVMFIQTFQRLPNVAGQISATMKVLQKAIKEAQTAASTNQAIQRGPIQMSAAQPPDQGQGPGAPGPGMPQVGGMPGGMQ
jgi:hypothetical protein